MADTLNFTSSKLSVICQQRRQDATQTRAWNMQGLQAFPLTISASPQNRRSLALECYRVRISPKEKKFPSVRTNQREGNLLKKIPGLDGSGSFYSCARWKVFEGKYWHPTQLCFTLVLALSITTQLPLHRCACFVWCKGSNFVRQLISFACITQQGSPASDFSLNVMFITQPNASFSTSIKKKICWLGFLEGWLFIKDEIHLLPHQVWVNRLCLIIFKVLGKARGRSQGEGTPSSFWISSEASGCTGSTPRAEQVEAWAEPPETKRAGTRRHKWKGGKGEVTGIAPHQI